MTQTELVEARVRCDGEPRRFATDQADYVGYFRYRLFNVDGSDIGDADYALMVRPGDLIATLGGRALRVTALVPLDAEHSPYTALFKWRRPRTARAERRQKRSFQHCRELWLLTFAGHVGADERGYSRGLDALKSDRLIAFHHVARGRTPSCIGARSWGKFFLPVVMDACWIDCVRLVYSRHRLLFGVCGPNWDILTGRQPSAGA
jgi:hypothetical protein